MATSFMIIYRLLAKVAAIGNADTYGLSHHEWQLIKESASDSCRVDNETIGNVVQSNEDGLGEEEHLGDIHSCYCQPCSPT